MRIFSFHFALLAALLIFGMGVFTFNHDSIRIYLTGKIESLVPGNFTYTLNENQVGAAYNTSPPDQQMDTSYSNAEDALHKILREIAICR
jgi:hypothetical protein